MALTFADTHNMIAYLTKSDASKGFDQIIDFLNASSIKYALTVNPNIYVSCIKQFWSSVLVKKLNDVMRLQALVDKKKVIITEATIRDALRLNDAETEEQPLLAAASPTTYSPGYILEFDPDEDPKDNDDEDLEEDPADYPADHDDDEEEEEPSGDDADEEDEEQDKDDDDEEEEHPASYLSDPSRRHCPSLRRMLRDFWLCLFPHHYHLLYYHLHYHKYHLPYSQHHPLSSPYHYMLHHHPKRLSISHCPGYEAGESSAAAARPIKGCKADYGFVNSIEAEIRRWRAEDIGYGIKDTWIDPRDVAKEEALTTLEGVNNRLAR
nr:hypothetical protein [Tanacetum cinerariifolium]